MFSKLLSWVGLALAVTVVFGSCQRAVTEKEPDPEPQPTPTQPTFDGSWRTTTGWYRDDDHVGIRRHTLTFTSDRFIERVEHICEVSECPDDDDDGWTESGTWTKTDTEITKIWIEDGELRKVPKRYYWNAAGTILVMHSWDSGDPDDDRLREYTKLALPRVTLAGTWTRTSVDEDTTHVFTFAFTAEGTLTYSHERTGAENTLFTVTGTFIHDRKKHFILHTITSQSNYEDGEEVTLEVRHVGQTLRSAYVPTSDANVIAMSPYWREQQWSPAAMEFVDRMDVPFGDYWWMFKKQN